MELTNKDILEMQDDACDGIMDSFAVGDMKVKKGLFGGYDQKGVDSYISGMKENMSRIKEQLEQQVRDISSEKANIIRECDVLKIQLADAEADIAKLHEQISAYRGFENQSGENEKRLKESEEEILRLRQLVQEYSMLRNNRDGYEQKLDEKDRYIAELNDKLNYYQNEYNNLKHKVDELEAELRKEKNRISSFDGMENVSGYGLQDEKLQKRCEELEERCIELERELETSSMNIKKEREKYSKKINELEKELATSELEIRSEREEYSFKINELENKLRQAREENKNLEISLSKADTREDMQKELDKNMIEMEELYKKLQTELSKNKSIAAELSAREEEINLGREYMKEEVEKLNAQIKDKEKQLEGMKFEFEEQLRGRDKLEDKIETLYDNYKKSSIKIENLEMELKERELLIEHYQENEKENILIKQELELSKQTVTQLKDTVMQVMKHMDTQATGLQLYLDKYEENREALNKAVEELTEIKLKNVELMDSLSNMTLRYEELVKENLKMNKDMKDLKREYAALEGIQKVIPLQSKKETQYPDKVSEKNSYVDAYEKAKALVSKFEETEAAKEKGREGLI